MAVVVDASAVIHVLLGTTVSSLSVGRRLGSEASHAPHLIDAEVGHVLRRRVLRGELPALDAEALLVTATGLVEPSIRHGRGARPSGLGAS